MTLVKRKNYFPSTSNLFDSFFKDNFFDESIAQNFTLPAVNVSENNDSFSIEVAVPGFKKEDFKIELNDQLLTISSEKTQATEDANNENKVKYTRKEFHYSTFKRSFSLPENVNGEQIVANYTDGILKLEIPKKEEAKKIVKNIEIK